MTQGPNCFPVPDHFQNTVGGGSCEIPDTTKWKWSANTNPKIFFCKIGTLICGSNQFYLQGKCCPKSYFHIDSSSVDQIDPEVLGRIGDSTDSEGSVSKADLLQVWPKLMTLFKGQKNPHHFIFPFFSRWLFHQFFTDFVTDVFSTFFADFFIVFFTKFSPIRKIEMW